MIPENIPKVFLKCEKQPNFLVKLEKQITDLLK